MALNQSQTILKNTVVLGLAQIIERLGTVYLSIFVARRLGAQGLGIYSVAMVYYGLLFLTAELGCTTYLTREIAKDPTQTNKFVLHAGLMSCALGIVLALAVRGVLPFIHYSHDLSRALYVIVWAIVPASLRAIQEAVFVAYHKAEFLTYSALIAVAVNIGAALFLLRRGHGVVSLVWAFTLVQFFVTMFYFLAVNRVITRLHWEFSPAFAWQMLHDIRAFTGSSLVQGVLSRPEVFLLSLTHSDAQIGVYTAALRIVDLWQLIPRSFMTTVFPILSNYYHLRDERTHVVRQASIKYLLAISFPVTAGLFIIARPVLRLLYGSGFDNSVSVMQILLWTIPLGSVWAILWRVLSARGEQGATFQSQVIALAVRLLAGFFIIRSFGSVGAAITTTVGMLVLDLLLVYQVRRDGSRINMLQLAGRSATAAVAMGAVTLLLRDHLQLWALIVVSAIAYVAMTFVLRTFSADDIKLFRRLWRLPST